MKDIRFSSVDSALTNISLWFSSKTEGAFVLKEEVGYDYTNLVGVFVAKEFNYYNARARLIDMLERMGGQDGKIKLVRYYHDDDCYEILVGHGDDALTMFRLMYVQPENVVQF